MLRSFGIINNIRGFATSSPVLARSALRVPEPTPQVPDVETFLKKIGRGAAEHLEHFPSWPLLFKISSAELKEKGVETALRRYILNWRYKFSNDTGIKLKEIKTGKKQHGGERKMKEVLAKQRILKRNELRERAAANAASA